MPHHLPIRAPGAWLLAQHDRLQGLSQRFQTGGYHVDAAHVAMFAAALLMLTIVLWRVTRSKRFSDEQPFHNPRRLFLDLCHLHELDWSSRRLLWKLAQARGGDHPAQVFLEPSWLDAQQLPRGLATAAPAFARIQTQLFPTIPQAAPPPEGAPIQVRRRR